jgi:hypothetical protein
MTIKSDGAMFGEMQTVKCRFEFEFRLKKEKRRWVGK